MSYVRSGLGNTPFYPGGALPAFNTSTPAQQVRNIPASKPAPVPMMMAEMLPITPAGDISHQAPPYVAPRKIVDEAFQCAPQLAQPLQDGRFECMDKLPMKEGFLLSESDQGPNVSISIGPSGQIQKPGSNVQAPTMPGSGDPDAPSNFVETTPSGGGGPYTLEAFKSVCAQVGGKVGPNCCKMPSGASIGLSPTGQLVQNVSCTPGGGLSGSVPLIAGAAVAAVVLMKFM